MPSPGDYKSALVVSDQCFRKDQGGPLKWQRQPTLPQLRKFLRLLFPGAAQQAPFPAKAAYEDFGAHELEYMIEHQSSRGDCGDDMALTCCS